MYEATLNHYIDGAWVQPTSGKSQEGMNPAKNTPLATLGQASKADLDKALASRDDTIFFDAATTQARPSLLTKAINAGKRPGRQR